MSGSSSTQPLISRSSRDGGLSAPVPHPCFSPVAEFRGRRREGEGKWQWLSCSGLKSHGKQRASTNQLVSSQHMQCCTTEFWNLEQSLQRQPTLAPCPTPPCLGVHSKAEAALSLYLAPPKIICSQLHPTLYPVWATPFSSPSLRHLGWSSQSLPPSPPPRLGMALSICKVPSRSCADLLVSSGSSLCKWLAASRGVTMPLQPAPTPPCPALQLYSSWVVFYTQLAQV